MRRRWYHDGSGSSNCFDDHFECGTPAECTRDCELEGISLSKYESTYGITAAGSELSLKFVTGTNVGSRTYLMNDDNSYYMFKLKNAEFTFDVDVSTLQCGMNGALYFVEMPEDGGLGAFPSNTAGANLGTGYCDAQCPHDMKM